MSARTTISADTVLRVDHLTMRFGGLVAIGDVSFEAKRGEITALIGPNGAGKTTVFNCITGFYKPTEGMITLKSRDGSEYLLERLPGHEVNRKAKVARTFQNIRLFSGMTVLENLLVAQHNTLMRASGFTILGLLGSPAYKAAEKESMELAKFWLDKARLTARADEPAGSLPYGDQRRLEIARAMCTKPELLCLDEPAAGLNPSESLQLNTLLNDIKATGASLLLIEHDMSVVMQISDHVVVLEYGRKISDGVPSFVRSDPKVIAAYLGVDDDEVEEVLVSVGDEAVLAKDVEPDPEHGPLPSSSMFAGPISDTIGHSDEEDDESVRVDAGASKAELVELIEEHHKAHPEPEAVPAPLASIAPAASPAPVVKSSPAKSEISNRLKKPRDGKADDLLLIKGIGPINQRKLNEHGIYHYDQIADWKRADIAAAEAYLEFDGRILREDWMGQAKILAAKAEQAQAAKPVARPAAKAAPAKAPAAKPAPAKPAAKPAAKAAQTKAAAPKNTKPRGGAK